MSNNSLPKPLFKNSKPQNASIPWLIISYILQRDNEVMLQKSEKFIYKISSVCKYFFLKLRLIPCYQMNVEGEGEYLYFVASTHDSSGIKTTRHQLLEQKVFFRPKILCTGMSREIPAKSPPKIISQLIPQIFNCRLQHFELHNQELTLQEFLYLSSNRCEVLLYDCKITESGNDSLVSVERLLELSPNLQRLSLYSEADDDCELNYCTPLTSQKLAEFPKFKYLQDFHLSVPETFQASHFFEFMKKNYKNGRFSTFRIKFKENVCPYYILNFKNHIDTAVLCFETVKENKQSFDGQTLFYAFFTS